MRPATSPTTDRLFDGLPEVYRAADQALDDGGPNAWPFLRFLSLLADQADEVAAIIDRAALHDYADAAWLPWQAQLAGLGLRVGSGSAETFDQLVVDYASFSALAADNTSFAL